LKKKKIILSGTRAYL